MGLADFFPRMSRERYEIVRNGMLGSSLGGVYDATRVALGPHGIEFTEDVTRPPVQATAQIVFPGALSGLGIRHVAQGINEWVEVKYHYSPQEKPERVGAVQETLSELGYRRRE